MHRLALTMAVTAALSISACGEDETAEPNPEKAPAASTAVTTTPKPASGYSTVSDVTAHAAIGKDLAEIRSLLEPATEGTADFAAAAKIFTEGQNSKKGDGSARTLAGFVEGTDLERRIQDALAGTGSAASLDPAERRQWIDKGLLAALRAKVLGELDAAIEKASAGETDSQEGAPHNVDEAWAFFEADGEGIGATAMKRAADFGLPETEPSDAVHVALADAQKAAAAGDVNTLKTAREATRGALNRIFALAIKKYATKAADDPVARQEGLAFTWALQEDLSGAARETITGAFAAHADTNAVSATVRLLDEQAQALGYPAPLPELKA